jgi:hypothetical protein
MLPPSDGASSFAGQAATPVADSSDSAVTSSFTVRNAYNYLSIDFSHSFHKLVYICISFVSLIMKGADPVDRAMDHVGQQLLDF